MALCLFGAVANAGDPNQNWIEVRSPHFRVLSNAGEREARHAAAQFEAIRAMFTVTFPNLRVGAAKPITIFALKNEDSLKLLLPTYGQDKNATRLAGMYVPTTEEDFALVRTDASGTGANSYHALYHEYTHALLHMNYRGLPTWLDEGIAEFYGGAAFDSKTGSFGMPDRGQLALLQQTSLVPIDVLVNVDRSSPLYNTQNHAGIFYAESWALVHYFTLSPEVSKKNLINKFFDLLQKTDDPVEAANQSFGDLKALKGNLEAYCRQPVFQYARINMPATAPEKDFTARRLEPAEILAARADFLLRRGNSNEGLAALHEAEALNPKLASIHDGLALYHYRRSDNENTDKELDAALQLDPKDAMAYLYKARVINRKSGYNKDSTPQMIANLEKAVQIWPDFATAHAFLSIAYTETPDQKKKSIAEAQRAIALEPGNLAYFLDLGRAALANGLIDDAKKIAARADKLASSPVDRAMAAAYARRVTQWNASGMGASGESSGSAADASVAVADSASTGSPKAASQLTSAEGQITELLCGHPPQVMLTLASSGEQILLRVKDANAIEIRAGGATQKAGTIACADWKDRKAKITFRPTPDGPATGEVQSISFE
ncbi:MAG TPA: hypothetical protein VGI16_06885 [Candidatus Acidoferrum sp.]|jgi:tetratricopeptide (TPR) repeat protein